jgi:SAM-dependent methyltransferase
MGFPCFADGREFRPFMDLIECGQLDSEQEFRHWWIRTRFHYLEQAVRRARTGCRGCSTGKFSVLEMGCGTRQNLRFLRTLPRVDAPIDRVVGVDPAIPTSLERADWMLDGDIVCRSLDDSRVPRGGYGLVVAMDVLEHVEDDVGALREWASRLLPGGLAFITVPAFPLLWSYHDEILGHWRRYTKGGLIQVARQAGLEPIKVGYSFSFLFLPMLMMRRVFAGRRGARHATDLETPPRWVNGLLLGLGALEAAIGGCPWVGTSVVGFFRN